MATRIAVLAEGRMQQIGAPQSVYDRPANLFVAQFIGSPPMNTISGTAAGAGEQPTVRTEAGAMPVAAPGDATAGAELVAGVRPEHIHIGGSDLAATVLNVELLGHERHVVCQVATERWTVRQESSDPAPGIGEVVSLGIDPGAVHLFDPTTTERVN